MKNNLSYYSELCEERTADFVSKHQKEYKLDELKKLINRLSRMQLVGTEILSEEYFILLHDIFQFMPSHERYFASVDKDRIKLYFEKISELRNKLSIQDGYFEYIDKLKQKKKDLLNIILPVFLFSNIFLKEYSVLDFQLKNIIFWLLTAVFVSSQIVYFWKKYQWKKQNS